jgi:hypothetical protein
MRRTSLSLLVLVFGSAVLAAPALHALSGKGEHPFPQDLGVLYGTVDRADLGQRRELYASAEALAAARDGKALPPGSELTMIAYAIARDAAGTPIANADGSFIKEAPLAYLFMRKRGAEASYPSDGTIGAWQFQMFGPDKRVLRAAKLGDCAACHDRRRDTDFVFTDDLMHAFASDARPPR